MCILVFVLRCYVVNWIFLNRRRSKMECSICGEEAKTGVLGNEGKPIGECCLPVTQKQPTTNVAPPTANFGK